jgi:ubiquinone/menaquinone biosynthesis C-methylase UbiE
MNYDGYHKYDRCIAESYDETRKSEAHWWREDQFVQEYFSTEAVGRLLDLPVGTGRFFRHYKSVQSLTGVDVSEAMLEQARKNLTSLPPGISVRLERGDVLSLRFAEREFDAAIVWRLFHLIPRDLLPRAVSELCRVTSKHVLLQSYVPVARHPLRARLSQVKSWIRPKRGPSPWSHIQAFEHDPRFVEGLFEENGFVCSSSTPLDKYEGKDVRASVYTRRGSHES